MRSSTGATCWSGLDLVTTSMRIVGGGRDRRPQGSDSTFLLISSEKADLPQITERKVESDPQGGTRLRLGVKDDVTNLAARQGCAIIVAGVNANDETS